MSYAEAQDHFSNIRGRLGRLMASKQVDEFLKTPHPDLNGQSPGRAIHSGNAATVHKIIDGLAASHR